MSRRTSRKGLWAAFAATGMAAALSVPALASAAPAPAGAGPYRIVQRVNSSNVCLDESFQFSVCQYGKNPDDPPALQKWTLTATGNGTGQIRNRQGGTYYCLDVKAFAIPCSPGDAHQEWARVSAGNGDYYVENSALGHRKCLDSFWTFKACMTGDKNQIWQFRPAS